MPSFIIDLPQDEATCLKGGEREENTQGEKGYWVGNDLMT